MVEFLVFGLKQARACVFSGSFLLCLAVSHHVCFPGLARYDFLLIAGVVLQLLLLLFRIESLAEAAALALFHVLRLALELFKTHPEIRSWSYPEPSFFRIGAVPLYSGFMYAAVASYMCQAWRIMQLRLIAAPSPRLSAGLALLVYANFFTHHFICDFRWPLTAAVVALFWKTKVVFRPLDRDRSMPLPLSFLLIGFFVWLAENIATYFGAWVYPEQHTAWTLVSFGKISSWGLLVIVTFVIVAALKATRESWSDSPNR
jgi:uncharacterized membrane protein YoaT (DUF817 family)